MRFKMQTFGYDIRTKLPFRQRPFLDLPIELVSDLPSDIISVDPEICARREEISDAMKLGMFENASPLGLIYSLDSYISVFDLNTDFLIRISFCDVNSIKQSLQLGYDRNKLEQHDSIEWNHVGYDVVDLDGLISGFFRGGFRNINDFDPFSMFYSKLNSFGLFFDIDCAYKFAEFRNNDIQEHAPYSVLHVDVHLGPICVNY